MTMQEAFEKATENKNDEVWGNGKISWFAAGWEAAIQSLQEPTDSVPYEDIISYFNEATGKQFRLVAATKDKIKARWKEGYTVDDFKHVIKTKTDQWIRDKAMAMYLRPQTLFGTKFDAYLNEEPKVKATLEEWQ